MIRITEQEIDNLEGYRAFINELLKAIGRRDEATIRGVIEMLHEARMRIATNLMTAEGWDFYHLKNLQAIEIGRAHV